MYRDCPSYCLIFKIRDTCHPLACASLQGESDDRRFIKINLFSFNSASVLTDGLNLNRQYRQMHRNILESTGYSRGLA